MIMPRQHTKVYAQLGINHPLIWKLIDGIKYAEGAWTRGLLLLSQFFIATLRVCQTSLEKESQIKSEKKPNRVKKAKLLSKHEI